MESSNILGYVDPLIVYPGKKTAVKVSCSRSNFTSKVLRLGAGYKHTNAPPISHELVQEIPQQTHRGTPQFGRIGSSAEIKSWSNSQLDTVDSISISFWCEATLLEAKHDQYLFSSLDIKQYSGFECLLDVNGRLLLRLGRLSEVCEVQLTTSLVRHQWRHLHFVIDLRAHIVKVDAQNKAKDIGERSSLLTEEHQLPQDIRVASSSPLKIASDSKGSGPATEPQISSSFNGKIEGFKITTSSKGETETLLDFDFSKGISTDTVQDVSNGIYGQLVNGPSRAVTGHDWDGSQSDWTRAPYGYGAIHFHDDDLDDAGWETSFDLELPSDLNSGCYAVFVDDGETTDYVGHLGPMFSRLRRYLGKLSAYYCKPDYRYRFSSNLIRIRNGSHQSP